MLIEKCLCILVKRGKSRITMVKYEYCTVSNRPHTCYHRAEAFTAAYGIYQLAEQVFIPPAEVRFRAPWILFLAGLGGLQSL